MPDITYMNGQQLIDAASAAYQAVSGMTQAEAVAAVGGESYSTGLSQIFTFPMISQEGGTPVTVASVAAQQAWDYAKLTGAVALSSLGAATAGAKAWASGVLFGDAATAGTLAGSGGLLTMSLPAAAAAIAPLLGVSFGTLLYESSPEFWTKVSQTLLPFCYEDKEVMPVVVDINGQVYMDKAAVVALQNLFTQEGIGQISYESDLDTGDVTQPIKTGGVFTTKQSNTLYTYVARSNIVTNIRSSSRYEWYGCSKTQGDSVALCDRYVNGVYADTIYATVTNPYTYDGETVYYSGNQTSSYSVQEYDSNCYNLGRYMTTDERRAVMWTIQYGDQVGHGYPEGTSQWEGDSVDISTLTEIPVVTGPSTTTPYIPITLPKTNPLTSPDPQEDPDPTTPVSPTKLDPFIPPVTPPEMWPTYPVEIPAPDPLETVAPQKNVDPLYLPYINLDPSLDPCAQPEPAPEPLPDIETIPKSISDTPSTDFPPAYFPTIIPSSGSGMIHVYNPTPAQFVAFGNWLWVTWADTTTPKLWNNPFDGVIGAHELYATPAVDGNDTIKSGFLDSGISAGLVRQRYTQINCGSILIPEYWANYLDYSPYSKAYVYLPFIGIVEVDVDDIVGHSVNITYHVDAYTGACIAQITVAKDDYNNTVYQFSGNCAVQVPMSGGSQASLTASMIVAGAYGIAGVMSGNPVMALGGVKGLADTWASAKSSVQHSGSFGASYGAMGIKRPYIIIRRPIEKEVVQYNDDYGYPAFKRVVLGSCTGYLRVREVHVVSSLATDDEKAKIESLLKSGVFVTDQEV